ncbi:MAG: von Willebrand factor type A domain-containing protein [Thermoanaerobaculia bacterium]
MNIPNERPLKDLLTMNDVAEAPADLADRIKAEIPADLGAAADAGTVGRFRPRGAAPRVPFRVLALAATFLAVVGTSFFTYRLVREPVGVSAVAERQRSDDTVTAPSDDRARVAGERQREMADSQELDTTSRKDEKPDLGLLERRVEESETLRSLPAEPQPAASEELSLVGAVSELKSLGYQAGEGKAGRDYDQAPETRDKDATSSGGSPRLEPAPAAPRSAAAPPPLVLRAEPPQRLARAAPMVTHDRLEGRLRKLEESAPAAIAPPSTGGFAEPNDAPYGDVFFDSAGVNPFIDTEDDARSTFGLDVDTGSYTVARRILHDGHLPPPESVRVEEFVNYFDYGDEPPAKGDFVVHAEGAPSIFGQNDRYYLLRFNVHAREIDVADRQPAHLVFVVDVSGSMDRENRLGLVKKALSLLLDQLRADDRISLVVYGSRGRVLLEPTSDRDAIRRAIDALRPEGATNAEEGLRLAYDLAARHLRRGAINRVILCSDGVANVGRTSADSILERIRRDADQGVELTTVGFGMGNYNDTMMERLADTGNGRYAYVDSLDEARRIFVEDLTGTLQTIAAEARVQVEFNPEVVSRYRLLGYENRDIADERFRDDTIDAGEIGAGHTVTALYEVKLEGKPKRQSEIATLHLRWASAAAGKMVEISHTVTGKDFAPTWDKASPALRLTSLVAEFAELLKQTYWSKGGEIDGVFFRAQQVSAEFAGDRKVAEFVSLVGRAAEYSRED